MKFKFLLGLQIFFMSNISAQLNKVEIVHDTATVVYSSIVLEKQIFFVTALKDKKLAELRFINPSSMQKNYQSVMLNEIPLFISNPSETNLVVFADASSKWKVKKLDKNKKIAAQTTLDGFMVVTSTAKISNRYLISGRGVDEKPKLIYLDESLNQPKDINVLESETGEANVISRANHQAIIVFNSDNGKSSIARLTSNFNLTEKLPVSGSAVSITNHDQGFALSYSKNNAIFIELLDKDFKPLWATQLYVRNNESSTKFVLKNIASELFVVGMNDSALTVTVLDRTGKKLSEFKDTSRLGMPTDSGYVVIPDKDEKSVHIFGVAVDASSKEVNPIYRFHFRHISPSFLKTSK
jgi:hypothetical protein